VLSFLAANLATILVGAVVFAIIAAVVVKMVKDRKRNISCGCGCSGCPNAKNCGHGQ